MNLAILIGVSDYDHQNSLVACKGDIKVMGHVVEKLNKFDDICVISDSPRAQDAKQKITEFVNKHKSSTVDELVFYYTGHGARYDEDFFYIFSDFDDKRKETTGLRNSELDGLIRNLSPELTIKIIDACYSGSTYVKSDSDIQPIFEKSAKDNELKKLYFLHSSSNEEVSWAASDYSFFSKSLFKSLTQSKGPLRYRDIMAYVADDMSENNYPKPTFIVQAENTELFGDIDASLIEYIRSELKISGDQKKDESKIIADDDSSFNSFLQLVQVKSDNEFCSQEEGLQNIELIESSIQEEKWPSVISDILTLEVSHIDSLIPNEVAIGTWLLKNKDEHYFVEPRFKIETYYKQQYVEVPKKPTSTVSIFGDFNIMRNSALSRLHGDVDYKLESVENTRNVLIGIECSSATPFKALQIIFKPKFNAIEFYALTIVPIFSRKSLVVFNSIEVMTYIGWDSTNQPKCSEWKLKKLGLKSQKDISTFCTEMISSTVQYIINDINSKLTKLEI